MSHTKIRYINQLPVDVYLLEMMDTSTSSQHSDPDSNVPILETPPVPKDSYEIDLIRKLGKFGKKSNYREKQVIETVAESFRNKPDTEFLASLTKLFHAAAGYDIETNLLPDGIIRISKGRGLVAGVGLKCCPNLKRSLTHFYSALAVGRRGKFLYNMVFMGPILQVLKVLVFSDELVHQLSVTIFFTGIIPQLASKVQIAREIGNMSSHKPKRKRSRRSIDVFASENSFWADEDFSFRTLHAVTKALVNILFGTIAVSIHAAVRSVVMEFILDFVTVFPDTLLVDRMMTHVVMSLRDICLLQRHQALKILLKVFKSSHLNEAFIQKWITKKCKTPYSTGEAYSVKDACLDILKWPDDKPFIISLAVAVLIALEANLPGTIDDSSQQTICKTTCLTVRQPAITAGQFIHLLVSAQSADTASYIINLNSLLRRHIFCNTYVTECNDFNLLGITYAVDAILHNSTAELTDWNAYLSIILKTREEFSQADVPGVIQIMEESLLCISDDTFQKQMKISPDEFEQISRNFTTIYLEFYRDLLEKYAHPVTGDPETAAGCIALLGFLDLNKINKVDLKKLFDAIVAIFKTAGSGKWDLVTERCVGVFHQYYGCTPIRQLLKTGIITDVVKECISNLTRDICSMYIFESFGADDMLQFSVKCSKVAPIMDLFYRYMVVGFSFHSYIKDWDKLFRILSFHAISCSKEVKVNIALACFQFLKIIDYGVCQIVSTDDEEEEETRVTFFQWNLGTQIVPRLDSLLPELVMLIDAEPDWKAHRMIFKSLYLLERRKTIDSLELQSCLSMNDNSWKPIMKYFANYSAKAFTSDQNEAETLQKAVVLSFINRFCKSFEARLMPITHFADIVVYSFTKKGVQYVNNTVYTILEKGSEGEAAELFYEFILKLYVTSNSANSDLPSGSATYSSDWSRKNDDLLKNFILFLKRCKTPKKEEVIRECTLFLIKDAFAKAKDEEKRNSTDVFLPLLEFARTFIGLLPAKDKLAVEAEARKSRNWEKIKSLWKKQYDRKPVHA